jgi:hypothetical protein
MTCLVDGGTFAGYPLSTAVLRQWSRRGEAEKRRRACRGCGGPKPDGRARLYCDECNTPEKAAERRRAASRARVEAQRQPCQRCGGEKPPGVSRRFCDECRPGGGRTSTECPDCGGEKPWRKRYCDDCRTIRAEAARARARAADRAANRPCAGCGGVKDGGRGRDYCNRCARRRGMDRVRICERCSNPARSPHAKLCAECKAAARESERAYQRAWNERNGLPRSGPTTNEARRMHRRLQRESEGHELTPAAPIKQSNGARVDSDAFPNLPAGPLAVAVCGLIRRTALDNAYMETIGRNITGDDGKVRAPEEFHREGAPSPREAVCDRLGIPSRALYDWERGIRATVGFDVADRVVTRAGWLWWDVWPDGEGYELARRAFEGD